MGVRAEKETGLATKIIRSPKVAVRVNPAASSFGIGKLAATKTTYGGTANYEVWSERMQLDKSKSMAQEHRQSEPLNSLVSRLHLLHDVLCSDQLCAVQHHLFISQLLQICGPQLQSVNPGFPLHLPAQQPL